MSTHNNDTTKENFISAHDTTTQTVAVAGTWQDINMATNDNIDGWTHTGGTADFTSVVAGTYKFRWSAFHDKTGGALTAVEVRGMANGVAVAPKGVADVAAANMTSVMSGGGSFTIAASQIFKMQLTGGTTSVQLNQTTAGDPTFMLEVWRMKE